MKRIIVWQILFLPLVMILIACEGQNGNEKAAKIRELGNSYTKAFNQQDPKALAAHWTADAKYVNPATGAVVQGRDAIEGQFINLFKELGNVKLKLQIESIVFPKANKAVEKGLASLIPPEGTPIESVYKVEYVKRNGKWFISRVSEFELLQQPTHYEQLKKLEWLVGEWIDEDEDVQILSKYSWDKYKNFLTHQFTVKIHDHEEIEGRQIIAWDPANQQIRSWVFDSDGGFGEGKWTQNGDHWIVELAHTLPDGRHASAINIYTKIDRNSYSFEVTGRDVEGEMLPNVDSVTVVRKKG